MNICSGYNKKYTQLFYLFIFFLLLSEILPDSENDFQDKNRSVSNSKFTFFF